MSSLLCAFEIESSGCYLPPKKVSYTDIAVLTGSDPAWILKATGVENRYYAEDETIASMAAKAIQNAMAKSSLKFEDITLLIAAGGTPDQPIPHNSALIHKELNLPNSITPFDVNGTCLSFVHALQIAASLINSGMHKNIIIVSSEKPSIGLNYKWPESAALFGDGAVAFIISKTDKQKGILFSNFETYSSAVHLAEIPAGGTRVHPKNILNQDSDQFLFKMEGQQIYKAASLYLPAFFDKCLTTNQVAVSDFKMIIPHQASVLALTLIRNKLNIPDEKYHINVNKYGNLVGASLPMSLHELIENKTLVEGDKTLLLATAAGLTIGAMGIQL